MSPVARGNREIAAKTDGQLYSFQETDNCVLVWVIFIIFYFTSFMIATPTNLHG